MLQTRDPQPTTGPQLRAAACDDLRGAIAHATRATNYMLALGALAPEMSKARHDRERLAAQIDRLLIILRNRATEIEQGA